MSTIAKIVSGLGMLATANAYPATGPAMINHEYSVVSRATSKVPTTQTLDVVPFDVLGESTKDLALKQSDHWYWGHDGTSLLN